MEAYSSVADNDDDDDDSFVSVETIIDENEETVEEYSKDENDCSKDESTEELCQDVEDIPSIINELIDTAVAGVEVKQGIK